MSNIDDSKKDPFARPAPKPTAEVVTDVADKLAHEVVEPTVVQSDTMNMGGQKLTLEEEAANELAKEALAAKRSFAKAFNPAEVRIAPPKDGLYTVTRADELGNPIRVNLPISKLTEADLDQLPIEGICFEAPPIMSPKAIDPNYVFHWVNIQNMQGANAMRYKAYGYSFAEISDVEGGEGGLVEGQQDASGHIKYYDVALMKINKLRLFQHYKGKLKKTELMMTTVGRQAAQAANNNVQVEQGAALRRARQSKHNVDFYQPEGESVAVVG